MKLNIEELAREADPEFEYLLSDGLIRIQELEAFARLIVERCAQEAEELESQGRNVGPSPEVSWDLGTLDAAAAIRNLLEDWA